MNKLFKLILLSVCCSLLTVYSSAQSDSSYKYLEINNVKARINSCGNLFWDLINSSSYQVPNESKKTSNFCSALWIGGKDKNGKLHLAGERYRQNGPDYYYGPIMDSLNYKKFSKQWNYAWKINKSTIDSFKANWSTPGYKIPASILNWPANGDTTLGEFRKLAPYYDNDHDGYYNPAKGDYPIIRGDQAVYFIANDDTIHTESGGAKLGIEIHGLAYSFNEPDDSALNQTTFLNYQIINRSLNNYDSVYIGLFSDIDIGYCFDDFIGCDTLLNSFYCYNGLDKDGTGQPWAYGAHPPAQAATFLNTKMNYFTYFINTSDTIFVDPQYAKQYYNILHGIWKDGKHLLYGGNGFSGNGVTAKKINFAFPGNLIDTAQWTEVNAKLNPADVRGVGSIGPLTFNKGETKCIDIAYIFARDYTGDNVSSAILLLQRIPAIQEFYNNTISANCDNISINAVNNLNDINNNYIKVYPNPADNYLNIETTNNHTQTTCTLYNIIGQKINSAKLTCPLTQINISNLNDGLYILKLTNNDNISSRKIIIKH